MKRILATCFFPAFDPPMSGGELKLLRFYEALSAYFHIDLVTFTYPGRAETIRHTETFFEHRVPKTPLWDGLWSGLNTKGYSGEMSGPVAALMARGSSEFRETMLRFWHQADFVFYDFPFLFAHDPFPADQQKIRVYNSHNLEAWLTPALVRGGDGDIHELVELLEEELCRASSLVFATSAAESCAFSLLYDIPERRIEVIPLGFDPADLKATTESPSIYLPDAPYCFFIGSQHEPNVHAAQQVLRLARRMPEYLFFIAGAVCERLGDDVSNNVRLLGRVNEEDKRHLFSRASVFLNLMRDGGGMNVKVVEALGAGLPVVTTTVGARGFEAAIGLLFIEDDLYGIEEEVRRLLHCDPDEIAAKRIARIAAAEDLYSWRALASRCAGRLRGLEPLHRSGAYEDELNPINLYLNDFPIGDGAAGGQKRLLELISSTPSPCRKVLLTLTSNTVGAVKLHAPDFVELNVPMTASHRAFDVQTQASNVMSVADVASAMFVRDNSRFVRYFQRLGRRAVNVTFEHCYMAPLIEDLPITRRPRLIYSSYNVEADLKAEMLNSYRHTHTSEIAEAVHKIEEFCVHQVDRILTVTEQDADRMQELYGLQERPTVILNGTQVPNVPLAPGRQAPRAGERLELIFIGSGHPPNTTAMHVFLEKVMPRLDNARLTIVGSVCEALNISSPSPELRLAGRVSENRKAQLLAEAHIAVNPLTLGGGSSLKVGDFLCAGLPVVTTSAGIRGFNLRHEREVLIAEVGDEFVSSIKRLRDEVDTWRRLAVAGETYARNNLDWRRLGLAVAEIQAQPTLSMALKPRSSVLAITYRYTEPRRGGAEEYLYRILSQIRSSGFSIDLIAPDVEEIINVIGMVTEGTGQSSARPLMAAFARSVRLFVPDKRGAVDTVELAERLHREMLATSKHIAERNLDLAAGTILVGGWHHPEHSGDRVARWTSAEATLRSGQEVCRLSISGVAPTARVLTISVNGNISFSVSVSGWVDFEHELWASPGDIISISCSSTSSRIDNDIRELGFRVETLALYDGNSWTRVSLQRELCEDVALRRLEQFMDHSAAIALARDPALDHDYLEARGLRSSMALEYLERVAGQYDYIIVHGVQFAFINDVAKLLHRLGVRYTIIPHMHLDDGFYHWRMQYDAVSKAAAVVVPENDHYSSFLTRFNSSIYPAPGGGFSPEEFATFVGDGDLVRSKHGLDRNEYFIVLGRKAPAKHYRTVMAAFARAKFGDGVELIVIGPDEDGLKVEQPGVRYLGPLPRQEVVALIKGSLGIISMSESESFGIVLVEAWAASRPVIANSGCAVYRELVEDGVDGFLVKDTASLSIRMRQLAADPRLRLRMGENGRAKAYEHFTWKRVAEKVIDAFTAENGTQISDA